MEHKKNEPHFTCHTSSTVYLLEPTAGMQCPLASGLGTNIFSASLVLAQVLAQFEFYNQMAVLKLSCNLETVILVHMI